MSTYNYWCDLSIKDRKKAQYSTQIIDNKERKTRQANVRKQLAINIQILHINIVTRIISEHCPFILWSQKYRDVMTRDDDAAGWTPCPLSDLQMAVYLAAGRLEMIMSLGHLVLPCRFLHLWQVHAFLALGLCYNKEDRIDDT